jgi:AraC-like DNA-binding protein
MSYREHAPPPSLARFVECFWTRAAGVPPHAIDVLPDGCVDLLVDLSSGSPRACVVGPMTRPHRVDVAAALELIAVRFRPGGACAFFDAPLCEWSDLHVPIADAWRDSARLEDGLAAARSTAERVAAMARELEQRRSTTPGPPRARRAAERAVTLAAAVRAAPPEQSIAALAAMLGLTRQHLARTFKSAVGLGPKMLQRITRMQRAIGLLERRGLASLAALALEAGYVDQSHLTNELRVLGGATPARWRRG